MKKEQHPYELDRHNHFDQATNRIAGFFGGAIAGLVIAIFGFVVAAQFSAIPIGMGFYSLIGSIFFFASIGAIWPKWFAWAFDLLSFW